MRNLCSCVLLLGIIPGNGNWDPKSLDPHLQVIVDELLQLNGEKIYDAYQENMFELRIEILLNVLDNPGIQGVWLWCIQGMHVVWYKGYMYLYCTAIYDTVTAGDMVHYYTIQ